MVAFLYRMPAGIPGDVNRAEICTVEAQVITPAGQANVPTAYGVPVNIDATSGQVRGVVSPDTGVYGFLVRPYPTQDYSGINVPLGTQSAPPASGACNVLRRGYITVKLNGGAAVIKNGQVYVRIANAATGKPIGGVEGAADGANTIAPARTMFMGPADANGNVEIQFNVG